MFYLYIIYSENSDLFYIDSSNDPWLRIIEHNTKGLNTCTSKFRPWTLKAVFKAEPTCGDAEKMERFIKKKKRSTLIEKLVQPNFIPNGKLTQFVRVPILFQRI